LWPRNGKGWKASLPPPAMMSTSVIWKTLTGKGRKFVTVVRMLTQSSPSSTVYVVSARTAPSGNGGKKTMPNIVMLALVGPLLMDGGKTSGV